MSKAVAIGERGLILGFKGVGVTVVPVEGAEAFKVELMRAARDPEVALVLVTETSAALDPEALKEFRALSAAILTTIPTHQGSTHFSFQEMRSAVERSIGVDMLGKD
ncbi:MAG TPA: V-type ATP synthase subunit F [Candidatus Hydrogenedentes bacterium]|nr:V-type ATP synthase subunit F [Candidatus Hydrogenedentota bacterium]HOH49408.1 V-type ATP synthase subunit F [Candidatus Hydrogenedentota bacterium]HRZ17003.1 V-type ATP synthase subunit F [Candidatus Hydrogenedentota bacterium]HRZ81724.1 V-type ATP synthase subunit F [Candidatus Hydrogenedentota bacterium]